MINSNKHQLIEWSEKQPKWQQDALRRLVKVGQANAMSETDINELKKILFSEANGVNQVFLPIIESDVPNTDENEPKTYLKSLGPVQNIDKLTSNQEPFEFVSPNGMTVIFGNNGSGKSGYARILKKLCHSQQDKKSALTIRGDITASVNADWTVKLSHAEKIDHIGEQIAFLTWEKNIEDKEFANLKRIAFFDSQVANIYVDGERELLYFPPELRLYTELVSIADKFSNDIKTKIKEINAQLPPLPNTTKGSKIHITLSKLDIDNVHLFTKEELHSICSLNDTEQIKLIALRIKKSRTPQEQKHVLQSVEKTLTLLAIDFLKSINILNNVSLDILAKEFKNFYQARADSKSTVASMAESMPIKNGIGSNLWFQMFEAARQFSAQVYPDGESPKISTGDYCVLCHLSLDSDAKDRLSKFDAFMDDTLQKVLNDAKQSIVEHQNKIKVLKILDPDWIKQQLQQFADLSEENEQHVSSIICDSITISTRHKDVVSILESKNLEGLSSLFNQDFNLKNNLKTVINEINFEIGRLDSLIGSESDVLSIDEQDIFIELEDKIKCCEQKNNLEKRFKLLCEMKKLNACLSLIDTKPITRQSTQRIKDLISDDLKSKYKKEIDSLKLNYLQISVGSKGQKGKLKIESKIENMGIIKKSEILSEGEQRAVALAGFLTEVNETEKGHAIILDDPVSSLDWDRRRLIAIRLAEEAKKRQVIIFTHDFSFALQLEKLCDDRNHLVTEHYFKQCWISSKYVGSTLQFGLTGKNEAAWEYKKVSERINTIKNKICKLKEKDATSDYDAKTAHIVNLLRQTWERAVEEIVFNDTVQRLSPEVKTKNLSLVKFDCDQDCRSIYEGMSAISAPLHDNPGHGGSASPTIADIEENLNLLEIWIGDLKAKRNKLKARQQEVKENQKILKTGGNK